MRRYLDNEAKFSLMKGCWKNTPVIETTRKESEKRAREIRVVDNAYNVALTLNFHSAFSYLERVVVRTR